MGESLQMRVKAPEGVRPCHGWDELLQVWRHFLVRICCAVNFGGDTVEIPPDEAGTSAVDQEVGDVLAKEAFSGLSRDDVVAAREINVGESEITNVKGEEPAGGVENLFGDRQGFMDEAANAELDVVVDEKDLEVVADGPAG